MPSEAPRPAMILVGATIAATSPWRSANGCTAILRCVKHGGWRAVLHLSERKFFETQRDLFNRQSPSEDTVLHHLWLVTIAVSTYKTPSRCVYSSSWTAHWAVESGLRPGPEVTAQAADSACFSESVC